MYNWLGHSRTLVEEVLLLQTEAFLQSGRTEDELIILKKEIYGKRPAARYPVIYNCEFMGFIDRERKKVGCLLHPDSNSGKNLRDISHHGRATCDEARCTAYSYLSDSEAELVAKCADDWYLYGLCITDLDLVKEFLETASDMVSDDVNAGKIMASAALTDIFRKYLNLKERWPYARNPHRYGKYYFVDRDYPIYKIDYDSLGSAPGKFDKILVSLGSEFTDKRELAAAEEMLGSLFKEFAKAFADEK